MIGLGLKNNLRYYNTTQRHLLRMKSWLWGEGPTALVHMVIKKKNDESEGLFWTNKIPSFKLDKGL